MATGSAAAATLVIHPGALGDFIQAVPALAALRAAVEDAPDGGARLVLVTQQEVARLAADLRTAGGPLFDEVVAYDGAALFAGGPVARLRIAAPLVRRIRAGAFGTAVICKAAPAYAALAAAARVPRRVGFAREATPAGRLLRVGLLTRAVPYVPGRHREDRYADLVAAAGADPRRPARVMWENDAAGRAARRLLAPPQCPSGAPLVGLAPGGARNAKEEMPPRRWPAARYAELAAQLVGAEPRAHIVLLGGPGDAAEAGEVRAALDPAQVLDLTGQTSLTEARAVIARLDAFVCNDSALMHLAATTGTPTVAVFGPSDPGEACPRRPDVVALWAPARLTACLDDVTGRLPPCVTPCCIERVHVAAVRAAVLERLRRIGAA